MVFNQLKVIRILEENVVLVNLHRTKVEHVTKKDFCGGYLEFAKAFIG